VIGYLGAFNYYHRFDLMYPLMERLIADGFPVKVMAVGGVPRKIEKHRRKTERIGMGDRFHFTGSIPYEELPQYVAAMDFTVVPGHTRVATPTKIFEFGAMGKACVAPDYEPIRALMPGKAGDLIFTPEDSDSLYKHVRILLDHPEKREELGTALRDNILANHTWDRHIDQILKIFEQMT
jgi:glycosyltransferase involved in cell wall biosynthesis